MTNCTLSANEVTGDAGGVFIDGSSLLDASNCIFWANRDHIDGSLGGPFSDESAQILTQNPGTIVEFSDIQGLVGGGDFDVPSNIGAPPVFARLPDPGPDGVFMGGDDDLGDLRLQSGSPAIDAGNNDAPGLVGITTDLGGLPRFLEDLLAGGVGGTGNPGTQGAPIVDMGAHEFLRDCDGNGIPDDQDLGNCAGDPSCSDCNANSIPDACDIAECDVAGICVSLVCIGGFNDGAGCADDNDCIDLNCNDCDLNGRPDECDDPVDSIPDGCVQYTGGGGDNNWGTPENWDLGGNIPDNVPGTTFNVTLKGQGEDVDLDLDVTVDSLEISQGASLDGSGGSLIVEDGVDSVGIIEVDGSLLPQGESSSLDVGAAQSVSSTNVVLRGDENGTGLLTVDGAGGNVEVNLTGELKIEGGGKYESAGSGSCVNPDSCSLNAGSVLMTGGPTENVTGGTMKLSGSMTVTTTGDFTMDGSGVDPDLPCTTVGLRVPSKTRPILPLSDVSRVFVAGNFALLGSMEISVGLNAEVHVSGNFINEATSANCIDWGDGGLILDGGTAPLRGTEQRFEVAGEDFNPTLDGFAPATASNTNFSVGTLEILGGSNVRFVDEFDNDRKGQDAREALYVHKLILRSGSIVTIDNCKVYYGDLINEGVTINFENSGSDADVPDHVARPQTAPFPHDRRKNRYISFDPDKQVNDDTNIAFRVELTDITLGSCDGGAGSPAQVDFCRTDRVPPTLDCNTCAGAPAENSCINQPIDCVSGTCTPTGETCVNDRPNVGGSNGNRSRHSAGCFPHTVGGRSGVPGRCEVFLSMVV